MEREKVTIYFLIILIAFFAYMISSLVYKESFKSQKEIKFFELSISQ